MPSTDLLASDINDVVNYCHTTSAEAGWWDGRQDFKGSWNDWRNLITPTKLCLIHSEVSEAMEGFRKNLMDDHLPHRSMLEVELADAAIRIFDLAGAHDLDLQGAIREKMLYNQRRADHKPEARQAAGGKRF